VTVDGKTLFLNTANVAQKGDELRRERNGPPRFRKLDCCPGSAHRGQSHVVVPVPRLDHRRFGGACLVFDRSSPPPVAALAGVIGPCASGTLGRFAPAIGVAAGTASWSLHLVILSTPRLRRSIVYTGAPPPQVSGGVGSRRLLLVASVLTYDGHDASWITLWAGHRRGAPGTYKQACRRGSAYNDLFPHHGYQHF